MVKVLYRAHLEENDGYAPVYPENDSEESRESMENPDIPFDVFKDEEYMETPDIPFDVHKRAKN